MHKNGKDLKYTSASQQGGCKQKRKHDCGTPPPQGEYWSGINPPILSKNNKVKGVTTNMLRKGGKKTAHMSGREKNTNILVYS